MTVMNGPTAETEGAVSVARRCAANVGLALKRLARPAKIRPTEPWSLPARRLAVMASIGLAVFLFGMFIVDRPVMRGVEHLPRWVIDFFDEITDYGKSGWFLWPLGLLFLGMAALPAGLTRISQRVLAAIMVRVGFLFAAIAVPGLFVNIVKHIFGRARPGVGGSIDPMLFSSLNWSAAWASLPSGHSATALSVLVAFGSLFPRARTALLIYALLICASRMAVTAHYPTDVAAGALVGIVGAMMVRRYFALRGLAFSVRPDGTLREFPGPSRKRIKAVARELLAE